MTQPTTHRRHQTNNGGMHLATLAGDKPLKIIVTGGGSGGHITPLLAVADEIKRIDSSINVISVGERGSKFAHLTQNHATIDATRTIFAGKFRRYNGESFVSQILDVKTLLLNIRDVFFVLIGLVQAVVLIGREKPDVVFLKGGFVGVPIGLAAALWRRPIVTHDSDALPGLANRIVARWAHVHATGMPAKYYRYDAKKIKHVGVLVGRAYQTVTPELKNMYRREVGIPEQGTVLFITGGSLGSQRINTACASFVADLLEIG